ncbi:COG1361 S-layer family protein [Anaerosporobacter sp.]
MNGNKRKKKLLSYIALLVMVFVNIFGNTLVGKASESTSQSVNFKVSMSKVEIKAGATQHVSIPFQMSGTGVMEYPDFSVDADSSSPIDIISDIQIIEDSSKKEATNLYQGAKYLLEFDVQADELAANGSYKLTISGTGNYQDQDTGYMVPTSFSFPKKLSVKVTGQKSASKIKLSNIEYNEEVEQGEEFDISLKISNSGDLTAKEVNVSLGDFSSQTDIVPNYSTSDMSLGDLSTGSAKEVTFPVKVTKKAAAGTKSLKVTVNWYDEKKNEGYTETANIFINVVVPEDDVQNNGKPNIVITNVTQSPEKPTAAGKVTVVFTVENKGKTKVKQLKFTPSNVVASGLSPVSSKPYIYIDELKAGKKKTVKLQYDLSEDVTEGLHELTYTFTYKYLNKDGSDYEDATENVSLFVRDVTNPKVTVNTSVPKLIISNFNTGDAKLKAGEVFTFTFDVKNTHASIAAKNIKVSISSENNIFSQTEGSNSFYIEEIPAGATITQSIELKVKGDAASNAYPLKITFDYEYEGKTESADGKAEEVGTASKTVDEILNLQVSENARPVVQDIYLSSYDEPRVNEATTLTFNFYNMGKSTLSNVTATVVSDYYQASDTSTKFIGNVEAGQGNTYEIDVIPLMEGDCPGKLKITYEDSNGDTIELFADFTQFINPQPTMDPGTEGELPVETPVVPEAKKAILPTWAFVIIQVVVFFVAIFVARKIVISLYKRKLRRQEEESL